MAKDTREQERKGGGDDRTLDVRESAHGPAGPPHSPFGLMRRLLDDGGVDALQAKATFTNGVLEITIPAPPRPRARSIEIQEGAGAKAPQTSKSA